jgi:putative hydrolase of the HAD superfamily
MKIVRDPIELLQKEIERWDTPSVAFDCFGTGLAKPTSNSISQRSVMSPCAIARIGSLARKNKADRMSLTAVIFDLFGTLVDDFGASAGAGHTEEMATALAVPYEQLVPLWRQTTEMRIVGAFETVEASIKYVCDAMNAHPRPEQISKAVEIRMDYVRRALHPKPDAIDTLSGLKSRGYKIGLVSNSSIEIPLLWHETPFANLIDAPIFSSRVCMKKPDLHIYHLACDSLAVIPNSCLYIADGEDHELAAAAKVGLHPVLIRNASQKTQRKLHQEANEWRGQSITNLSAVLEIVQSAGGMIP